MRASFERALLVGITAVALLGLHGCAAIALTVFAVGAGTASGTGVSYTLDSIAYKTFTAPLDGLRTAVLMTLKRMDVTVEDDKEVEGGRAITGKAGDRAVEIELDKLTENTTRIRVVAKKNFFVRDRATATEIILQTDQTLTDNPHLAGLGSRAPATGARAKQK